MLRAQIFHVGPQHVQGGRNEIELTGPALTGYFTAPLQASDAKARDHAAVKHQPWGWDFLDSVGAAGRMRTRPVWGLGLCGEASEIDPAATPPLPHLKADVCKCAKTTKTKKHKKTKNEGCMHARAPFFLCAVATPLPCD